MSVSAPSKEEVMTCRDLDFATRYFVTFHLYGLTRKQIECYVRCGTPFPPDFILRMDDDEFDMVGLKDTIQTARLLAWAREHTAAA